MSREASPEDIHKVLFSSLVLMFANSAMQGMGKIVNPMTEKAEINLESAQASIDLLEMLQAKTRGNLSDEEKTLLADTLSSLQMTYVETARTAKESGPPGGEPGAADTPAPSDEPGPADQADEPDDSPDQEPPHEPKYHKSYG